LQSRLKIISAVYQIAKSPQNPDTNHQIAWIGWYDLPWTVSATLQVKRATCGCSAPRRWPTRAVQALPTPSGISTTQTHRS